MAGGAYYVTTPPQSLRREQRDPMTIRNVAIGDFNADGVQDLAVARLCLTPRCGTGNAVVLLGNGDGSLQSPQDYLVGRGAGTIVVGDFNGDGLQDLAAANSGSNKVWVLITNTGQ